jgi:plastocyanin
MRRSGPFCAGLLLIALACGAGSAGKPAGPRIHTVRIEGMAFSPATITVAPGDTVEFVNADLVPHTVTERSIRAFDSGTLNPKGTWRIVCEENGLLEYRCIYHPTMLGSITVASAGEKQARIGRSNELCGAPAP